MRLIMLGLMGKEAAAYAEQARPIELEYYDIVCSPAYGPISWVNALKTE